MLFALDGQCLGQINPLLVLATVGSFVLFVRGRDFWSGVSLCAAGLIKVTPLLLLAWFFVRAVRGGRQALVRALKVTAGVLAGGAVFGVLLPLVVIGPSRTFSEYTAYFEEYVRPVVASGSSQSYRRNNQALPAVTVRCLYVFGEGSRGGSISDRYKSLRELSMEHGKRYEEFERTAALPMKLLSLAVIVLTLIGNLWKNSDSVLMEGVGFSSFVLAMLIIGPVTWTHHYVYLLFPVTVMWACVIRPTAGVGALRWGLALCLIALLALTAATAFESARILGNLFWASVLLWLGQLFAGLFGGGRAATVRGEQSVAAAVQASRGST
jgi:hypothetical protein